MKKDDQSKFNAKYVKSTSGDVSSKATAKKETAVNR